jgi:tellurite resistance protein TehA-like permease
MPEEKSAEEAKAPQAPATPTAPKEEKPPEPKWLFYVLSFIVGLFGIIFGIVYMTKENEESKKFGKICLLLGLLPIILGCLCWIIAMVLGIGTSFLGGMSDYSSSYNY